MQFEASRYKHETSNPGPTSLRRTVLIHDQGAEKRGKSSSSPCVCIPFLLFSDVKSSFAGDIAHSHSLQVEADHFQIALHYDCLLRFMIFSDHLYPAGTSQNEEAVAHSIHLRTTYLFQCHAIGPRFVSRIFLGESG